MALWISLLLAQSDFSVGGMSKRFGPEGGPPKEKAPLVYLPPDRPCPPARHNGGMAYQVGGPPKTEAGDFSSTQAQVLYAGDAGPGVDRVLLLEMQNNCLSEKPEPPWWGGFRPEPAVFEWRKKGAAPAAPLAIARGLATWSNHAILLYGNGWVTTAGTATSQGSHPVLKLPAGKLPTALAVSPRNELALVTVIDSRKGAQLAVIALEACAPGFAHDWHQRYPLFPNQGSFSDLKLLGFIDLPLKSASGISASTNNAGGRLSGRDGNVAMASQLNLDDADTRERLAKDYLSGSGYAVVVSREENKAVFVDLQPLLEGVRDAYAARDFSRGESWPPTFEKKPEWTPVVVADVEVPRPSSVLARAAGGEHNRAFLGLEEGEIRSFSVGGLGTNAPAKAEDVKPSGALAVGKNPCWLAVKGAAGGPDCGFIVVSRGERALQWVSFGPQEGKITRELRDRRMIDPVYCEIADTHGIEMQLVTVADFRGRKIINYRCSPVVFATNGGARYGCGPKGTDEFECGGILPIPGFPLAVCGTNVN
ncbi:MAG TPA: hypothetical protein VF950_15555 [Planctomycetota bacterium]